MMSDRDRTFYEITAASFLIYLASVVIQHCFITGSNDIDKAASNIRYKVLPILEASDKNSKTRFQAK